MIHRLIRRLALAALDCGPSTLRHALDGDADASRVLASQGVTRYDLTAIADARAARRRDGYQPRPKPGADPAPLTPPSMRSGVEPAPPGADYPRAVPVFWAWGGPDTVGFYDADLRISDVDIVLVADANQWRVRRGEAEVAGGSAPDIDAARAAADAYARAQGWVLLDAEPDALEGCTITFSRGTTGRLCYLKRDTTPSLCVLLYPDVGWSVWYHHARLAHGPQTGAEGERLLRAALTALGVEVLDG